MEESYIRMNASSNIDLNFRLTVQTRRNLQSLHALLVFFSNHHNGYKITTNGEKFGFANQGIQRFSLKHTSILAHVSPCQPCGAASKKTCAAPPMPAPASATAVLPEPSISCLWPRSVLLPPLTQSTPSEIGRASCRERV